MTSPTELEQSERNAAAEGVIYERRIDALLALNERLRAVAGELAVALRKHRADMHNTSNRPCGTCRQSAKALAEWDALDAP